ncbi:MAG: transposase [Planctomycetota bacterium]|jgi:transposase
MTKEHETSPPGEGRDEPLIAPEAIEVERSETEGDGGAINGSAASGVDPRPPNPEVSATARRRSFTAAYKQRIVREADQCSKPGEIGALLRREGLYSSLLAEWRRSAKGGGLTGLASQKRGPKPNPARAELKENELLKKKVLRLERELKTASLIIDVQKKVSEVLGIRLETIEDEGQNS